MTASNSKGALYLLIRDEPYSQPDKGYVCDTCGQAGGEVDSHWKQFWFTDSGYLGFLGFFCLFLLSPGRKKCAFGFATKKKTKN